MSFLDDRELLYFVHARGCPACEQAEPELATFQRLHPSFLTLQIDAAGPFPRRLGLKIKETPTYFYRKGQEGIARSGIMTAKDLDKWLRAMGANL